VGFLLWTSAFLSSLAATAPQDADPIRLPLTFVQSSPVTTISVDGLQVPAVVDISGGDADGALTLSRELIERANGVDLGRAVASDAYGHDFTRPRFRIPEINIGGQAFRNLRAVQAVKVAGEEDTGPPNAIGKHFLSRFFVVVDYANALITLWPPDTKDPVAVGCGRIRIPMERTEEDRLPVSRFNTSAKSLRLLWSANGFSALPETLVERLRLTTVTPEPGSPKIHLSKALSAAGQNLGPVEFVVLPLKLPRDFDGMLGRNFFDSHVVCLDYRRREIHVR
jgi:hypothetical protein